MNLSLKERCKPFGKFGITALIIYYSILIVTTIYIGYDCIKNKMSEGLEVAFLALLIFNTCTLWKLDKRSFWITILTNISLILFYGSVAAVSLFVNALVEAFESEVSVWGRFLEIFSGLSTIFLLIFLVFIIVKREVFDFKGKSINMDE